MNPKMIIPTHLLVILVLLGTTIPRCFCQNNTQYETCQQPFECGSLREIRYPFWGGNRPSFCGHPGFELSCRRGNIAILNISSTQYRVLNVDNNTQTLIVARDDLSNSLCPTSPANTTLDFNFFHYSSTANDQNITLFYGCSQVPPAMSPNQFICAGNSVNTSGLYFTREGEGLTNSINCSTNIYVLVNRTAAQALSSSTATSINLLQSSLRTGFSIKWSAENNNCNDCVRSSGMCVRNEESGSFACYCTNRTEDRTCGDSSSSGSGNKTGLSGLKLYVVIGVSIGIAGLAIASSIILYIRKRRKTDLEFNHNVDKFLYNHGSLAPKRYTYTEIQKITKSFRDKLGQGGYGIVYKGKLSDGQLVAVKVLMGTNDDGEEFINEVASISRTSHVNIVNLLGFCYERKTKALVYEFMPNKSLDRFIYKSTDSENYLEWEKLYEIASGIARGLEYLHRGCNTRIVHFDIKPQNILLDEDFCPKISDFGLAKLVVKKQSMISMLGARGTFGYIAPEVFSRNFGGVSHKSDVYSYGMMLLEMAGARKVAEIEATQSTEDYFPDKIYEHVLLKNEKLDDVMSEKKEETSMKMLLVGLWCIQTAPSDRPSITKVVEMLEGSLQSIQIPPKPTLFCSKLSGRQFSSSFSVNVEIESSSQG